MSKPMEPGRANSSAPNFGPNRPSVDPKWDALQRAGADFSGYELEHPVDIAPFEADLYYVIRLLVVSSLISLLVTAFVVWPINRFVGTNLASSESVPVWILLSLLLTIGAIIMRCPWWLVAGCALSGPAASLYFGIVNASTRQGNGGARLVLVLLSLGLLGVLVDSIATHYLHWLTAGDHVLRSVRDRRRIWWGPRFNSGQLWLMKEELVQGAKQECGRGNISLAQAYLGHATELDAMLGYETGLTVLLVYAALAILPNGFFLLILVPPALVLFFRAGTDTLEVLMTALEALFSWFSYGRFGTDAPGVFQSPIASCLTRGAFAVAVLFLLATVFTPPLPAFYGGILFSADWFWGLLLKFIGSLVLPVLVLLTVLVSAAGEILAQVRLATVEGGLDHALTDGKTRWDIFVEKIRASSHPVERDQLWLGLHTVSRYPVYLDPLILREHAHFLGDSGSGKTALGLAPLIVQIIQRALEAVIIIDLKGAWRSLKRRGLPLMPPERSSNTSRTWWGLAPTSSTRSISSWGKPSA